MTWRAIGRIVIGLTYVAVSISTASLKAQSASNRLSGAVDAQGVRHGGSDYPGRGPWMNDVIKTVQPDYPYAERAAHREGWGLFRIAIDLNTGSVNKVTVLKSTGIPAFDRTAIDAFRRWRWKPGKWKEVDAPIVFTLSPTR
jgi:TonB family protein